MTELWANLLPILAVMFISPARTLAVILLLHTPKKAVTALAYIVGMICAMMVQGVLVLTAGAVIFAAYLPPAASTVHNSPPV